MSGASETDEAQAIAYLTGALTGGPRPAAIGLKFDEAGEVLPTPGNTTICHIAPQSTAHAALVRAQNTLRAGPLADAFTFLPPASFHMTIFEGVIDYTRERPRWPSHLPLETPVEQVTHDFDKRLQGLGLAQTFRTRPLGIRAGFSVAMAGATADDEALLRRTREQLREATGIARPDHDSYAFHITLAYLLRWLSEDEAQSVVALSRKAGQTLIAEAPEISLGPVEFCAFDTMHHFQTRHLIS